MDKKEQIENIFREKLISFVLSWPYRIIVVVTLFISLLAVFSHEKTGWIDFYVPPIIHFFSSFIWILMCLILMVAKAMQKDINDELRDN